MIAHEKVRIGQIEKFKDKVHSIADKLDRQEVTPEYANTYLIDKPVFIWVENQIEFGLDPWRMVYDWQYLYKDGMRLFVQKKDL